MTKYLKCFQTHSDYNTYITGQDKVLPNVSYCEDNNEVHYNIWYDPERFVAKFNVTSTTSATSIFNDPSLLKELEIDGVIYTGSDIYSHMVHTFSTTGIHTVKYTLNDNVTSISGSSFSGKSDMVSITIPNTITTISGGTFQSCRNLKTVIIPDTVTTIDNGAFQNCSGLKTITIPNGVTSINNSAFSGCTSLINVDLPNSVTTIGYGAFGDCTSLKTITIPNSVTNIIGGGVFGNCTSLKRITIPSSVTTIEGSIGDFDFEDVTFEPINPNATFVRDTTNKILTNIAGDSLICGFNNTITIPDSVTSIGNTAFNGCTGLTSVIIGNSVTTIGNGAFSGCQNLTSVTIPNSVTSIGNYAFNNCTSLTSVTIPNSVTSIGESAFRGCSSLTSMIVNSGNSVYDSRNNCNAIITASTNSLIAGCQNTVIPNTITIIGDYAFYQCTGLTSITIPNSVTSIRQYAFNGCSGLTSITIEATTPPTLYNNTVFYNTNDCPIYVPSASVNTYKTATDWRSFASRIQAIPTT